MKLNLDGVTDEVLRDNLEKLNEVFQKNPFLSGEWKFFEKFVSAAGTNIPIKHGMSFVPTDIVVTYLEGDYNAYFRTDLSDRDFVYLTAAGPCFVRFIAGRPA
jgi:hypothetical protein